MHFSLCLPKQNDSSSTIVTKRKRRRQSFGFLLIAVRSPPKAPSLLSAEPRALKGMFAFVPASCWVSPSAPRVSPLCARRAPFPAPKRAHLTTRMCADAPSETTDSGADSAERPVEPYSGYYADMKRMGLTEEQAFAQATKAAKQSTPSPGSKLGGNKNLLKPDGTPYAPWMTGVSVEYDNSVIKSTTDAKGRLGADPQRQELSGIGVDWKMLGDELELRWATGSEEGNVGFVVSRKTTKSDEWETVCDYRDATAELQTKGASGGKYSFIVTDPSPGNWLYRISDVDSTGNRSDLSQCLVEIQSAEEGNIQKIALAVLLVVLAISVIGGLTLDPMGST